MFKKPGYKIIYIKKEQNEGVTKKDMEEPIVSHELAEQKESIKKSGSVVMRSALGKETVPKRYRKRSYQNGGLKSNIESAGVLLWTIYKNEVALILVGTISAYKGDFKYDECGGEVEEGECLKNTACRELQEESCNLFSINPQHCIEENSVVHYGGLYKCYNINITTSDGPIVVSYFDSNYRILKSNKSTPKCFLEQQEMKFFYIKDIINSIFKNQQKNNLVKSVDGQICRLGTKSINSINLALNQQIYVNGKLTIPAVKVNLVKCKSPTKSYLCETFTYQSNFED